MEEGPKDRMWGCERRRQGGGKATWPTNMPPRALARMGISVAHVHLSRPASRPHRPRLPPAPSDLARRPGSPTRRPAPPRVAPAHERQAAQGLPVERAEGGDAGGVRAVAATKCGGRAQAQHAVPRQLHRVQVAIAPPPLPPTRTRPSRGAAIRFGGGRCSTSP